MTERKPAGGIPMNERNDNSQPGGVPGWWANPPRPGLQRLINPWEFRHLRFCGGARVAGGCVAAVPAFICLAYGVWGWAAFFLAIAAANVAGGYWYLSIARSAPAPA
jgi:hypothetical protein